MEELEKWKDQISNFEKLNIVEAKELYKKVVSTGDVKLKKLLMDKLILGTLYVVSNYIERNNLKLFCSSSLDMNDIISTLNEIWIKKINNGELLYVDNFSFLFNTTFFREVCNILVSEEIVIKEQFGINIDGFIDLFIKFITLKNQAPDFSNKKLMAFNSDNVYNIIELFEKIYNNLDFEEYDDLNLGKTKIFQFLKMIIGLGLTESISDDMAEKTNMEDEVIKEIIFKLFIVDVDLVLKDELQRKIIHKRFGLDNGNQITLEDVAKNYNVTRERVRQIESVSLRKLRKSKEVRNYILIGGI